MHWGITQISPQDLVEHHKGIQPYLFHRFSQSSNQYFCSSEVVLTAVSTIYLSLHLIVIFIIHLLFPYIGLRKISGR